MYVSKRTPIILYFSKNSGIIFCWIISLFFSGIIGEISTSSNFIWFKSIFSSFLFKLLFKFSARIFESVEEGGLTLQSLLVPYVFSANLKETEFLENNLDALNSSGIEIIPFGENTFKVSAVPSILSQMNLKEFFSSILEETTGLSRKTNEALKNKIARHACRSAVKAGNKLSEGEIDVLLKSFKENKNVLLCPHGRPIVVVFKKTEIEKWFKRIV